MHTGQNVQPYGLCQGQKVLKRKLTTADPHHRDKVPFKSYLGQCEDASSSQ